MIMNICKQEKRCAVKFLPLLGAAAILLGLVVWAWLQASSVGGYWWILFIGTGTGAMIAGEVIKRKMELLVKMSRQARAEATGRPPSDDRKVGFTLVEIMTAVALIGILSSLAVPTIHSVRSKAQNSALMNDLRTFESAFLLYHMESGQWPEDRNRATLPPEMDGYIPSGSFTRQTPIGGHYDWDPSTSGSLPGGIGAAVSVRGHQARAAQLESLVKSLSGGSTNTGQIRVNGSDIHFVLQ